MPDRLIDAIEALDLADIKRVDRLLGTYAQQVIANIQGGWRDWPRLVAMRDAHVLHKLLDAENARDPELNLVAMRNVNEVNDAIRKLEHSGHQGTVRFLYRTRIEELETLRLTTHFQFADVDLKPDATSIVLFDSAFGSSDGRVEHPKNLLYKGINNRRISTVTPRLQAAQGDCIMFSLHFALQSRKTGFADELHRSGAVTEIELDPSHELADRSARDVGSGSAGDSRHKIPAPFLMHSQRRALADDRDAGDPRYPGESLAGRLQSFSTEKVEQRARGSVSIDTFRLESIARAVNHASRSQTTHPASPSLATYIRGLPPAPAPLSLDDELNAV